jgi:hypothetical protein
MPPDPAAVAPVAPPVPDAFVSVQVNVDAFGNNIPGDAANESSIAVDPTNPNNIVIGWRQFDTISSNFRQAGYAYSHDGGRTWTFPGVFEPGVFRSDPVLDSDADGNIYYLSLYTNFGDDWHCDVFTTADGGVTWPSKSFAYGGDKSWLRIDKTGGPGHGNMYQGWNVGGNIFWPNIFSRSFDHGQTWDAPMQYQLVGGGTVDPVFGTIAIGPGSEVYVAGIPNGFSSSFIWVIRSDNARDPGASPTWSVSTIDPPMGFFDLNGTPNPDGLLAQVWIDVDRSGGPTHGNVYVLATAAGMFSGSTHNTDLAFFRSTDGGATWSNPIRVNDDPLAGNAWRWMSAMAVSPNGRIDITWNDTRNSGQSNISELYYAFSTDGGNTWSTNTPLGPPWNSHVGWPNQNKIGDYTDMVSDKVGAFLAYPATYNGEQDVYCIRINDYDCNDNGVGDSDDILAGTSSDLNNNTIPDECECPPDFNGDTVVDSQDFIAFLNAFTAGDPAADFNNDGIVNSQDFIAFLNAFTAGC